MLRDAVGDFMCVTTNDDLYQLLISGGPLGSHVSPPHVPIAEAIHQDVLPSLSWIMTRRSQLVELQHGPIKSPMTSFRYPQRVPFLLGP